MNSKAKYLVPAIVLLSIAGLFAIAAALGWFGAVEKVPVGPVFERLEIADKSGDVKLVGDIDGDGLADMVLGGHPDDGLTWWRWPDLNPTLIARPKKEFTTDGALADVDRDGDLDIVVPDGSDGPNLKWFENPLPIGKPDDGGAWRQHDIAAIGDWGKDVETADFDGDGDVDIATRSPAAVMIYFHDGADGWTRVDLTDIQLGEEGMFSGDVDADGDVDLILQGVWCSNPGGATARDSTQWSSYTIGDFNPAFKAVVTDLDQDGRPDILASSSEHTADVVWFSPDNGPIQPWTRHLIEPAVQGAHTLQAADIDGDGDTDVVVGQMHTTKKHELSVYYNVDGKALQWARQVIDHQGIHNGVVADIGADGDFDIFGANWVGNPPLRAWINQLNPSPSRYRIDKWSYRQITGSHVRSFGLAFGDVDGDGRTDVVSGPFWYRAPADLQNAEWEQIRLAEDVDAIAVYDLDGDGHVEIVAQQGGGPEITIALFKARQTDTLSFDAFAIGTVPAASHALGSQGHAVAQILPGNIPEIVVSSGGGVFYFEAPSDALTSPWRRARICEEASDEGIAVADFDRDGRPDLAATTGAAKEVAWWRNPGDGSSDWPRHEIGRFREAVYPDRIGAADIDGDGLIDVVVTEENGEAKGAEAYWWRHPADDSDGEWERRLITSRGSLNSMSLADMDGDGDCDVVMGEHRGALRLSIWNNVGEGRFVEQEIGEGKESHLGAMPVDIDGDGDFDIVSIGWDVPEVIHLWLNDSIDAGPSHESRN